MTENLIPPPVQSAPPQLVAAQGDSSYVMLSKTDIENALSMVRTRSYQDGYTDGERIGYQAGIAAMHNAAARVDSPIIVRDKDALGHGSNKRDTEVRFSGTQSKFHKDIHEDEVSKHADKLSVKARSSNDKDAYWHHSTARHANKVAAAHHRAIAHLARGLGQKDRALHHEARAEFHTAAADYHGQQRHEHKKGAGLRHTKRRGLIHRLIGKGIDPSFDNPVVVKAISKRMKKRQWISAKVAIIMKDGIKGHPAGQAQAVAVAHRLWEKKRNRRKPPSQAKAMEIVWLATNGIAVSPEDLQYKDTDGAEDGLNEERRTENDNHEFDPLKVPPIAVWVSPHTGADPREKKQGQVFVVDGHKRLGQARKRGVPAIRAFFISASSFADAKKKGEELNRKMGTKALSTDPSALIVKDKDALGHGSYKKGEGPAPTNDDSDLSPEKVAEDWAQHAPEHLRADYHKTMTDVLGRMSPVCRKLAVEAVRKGSINWHDGLKSVKKAAQDYIVAKGITDKVAGNVGGFVGHKIGGDTAHLHIDGGVPGSTKQGDTAQGIYAHELGHCVDVGRRYSTDPKWEAVWKRDIFNGKHLLSSYARVSAIEGFAEFHRALVQGGKEKVRLYFPNCVKHFESKGLI